MISEYRESAEPSSLLPPAERSHRYRIFRVLNFSDSRMLHAAPAPSEFLCSHAAQIQRPLCFACHTEEV